ncbi:MAG: hypothetical protein ACTS46_01955 [Candidatus Hodgkinia cicadicola]
MIKVSGRSTLRERALAAGSDNFKAPPFSKEPFEGGELTAEQS